MKNLITICVFLTLTACSGTDFQVGPPPPEDTGNEAAESGSETSNDSEVKDSGIKDSDVADSNDVGDSAVDTKEIDVCGSKYSCSKQDDYACLNMKGNPASAIYDGNCAPIDNYYSIKKTEIVSADHCSKITFTAVHKCVCDDGCNKMELFFYIDDTSKNLSKSKCDAYASMWGKDKCVFF